MGKKRILFFAEGITMTHFVRPAALAQTLDSDEWEIAFFTPKRYHSLLDQKFHRLGDLKTKDPAAFLEDLNQGRPAYDAKAIRDYVIDDLKIIREVRPDFIFGDFRLSLCISAVLSGVPFGSIFNAQWSGYRKNPAIVPGLPITRRIPPALLNPLFALLRPHIYAKHAQQVNQVRREYGLSPIKDIRNIYTAGDLVIYPDIPEFVPVYGAPEHHHYVGTCNWAPSFPKPEWWNEVMKTNAPKVFVSLGSSGAVESLPAVMEAASALPIQVILSKSGRKVRETPGVFSADLLPFEETASRCAAVVSHGGTGSLYPSFAGGSPMLCIPKNIDNHISSSLIVKKRLGLCVRVEHATPLRLRRALKRLLTDPSFKTNAKAMSRAIARYDTKKIFPGILKDFFKKRMGTS